MVYSNPMVEFKTSQGTNVTLAPHTHARPGFEVRYLNYGVSFSSTFAEASDGPPRFLSGGLTDIQTFYHGDAWGFEGYHRYARGFYSQTDVVGAPEFSHPGMTLQSTSATLYRAMGEEFRVYRLSEGLATTGVEPDAMLTFALSQNHLRDNEAFMRGSGVSGSRFDAVQDLNIYSASVGAGLALSTNAGGLYFDPALFAGVGMQYREWDGHPETTWNLVKVNLRMRMGYRTRWFNAGAGFENDAHVAIAAENESVTFNALVARALLQIYL